MKKVVGLVGVALVSAVIVAGFLAYFTTTSSPAAGTVFDGLGRSLSETPWFVRLMPGQGGLWAGGQWFFADIVIFWAVILSGGWLAIYGLGDRE